MESKFKVGDRVRTVVNVDYSNHSAGEEGTVAGEGYNSDIVQVRMDSHNATGIGESSWTPFTLGEIELVPTESEIKVGQVYEYQNRDYPDDGDNGLRVTVTSVFDKMVSFSPGFYLTKGSWQISRFLNVFNLVEDSGTLVKPSDFDPVAKPQHYNHGKYEVIDVIEDWGLDKDYYLGNAIKYIARHKHKDSPKQDIEKAVWYLNRWLANTP